MLRDRVVVLGVAGGIAAYKVVDLASYLVQQGAQVHTVMTPAATRFVTPLTFQAITHHPVAVDTFELRNGSYMAHIELAHRADAFLVAPATADLLARMAHGLGDDLLTTTLLATRAPVVAACAMEHNMWHHPATQANLATLRQRGVVIVEPEEGRLASGAVGKGRLAEREHIVAAVVAAVAGRGDLAGKTVVVSAGGTREAIDPVRFIGNRSTGKQGYAVAEAARDRGATTILVSGPSALRPPPGVRLVPVESALEMQHALQQAMAGADVLVMAAAVGDFRAAQAQHQKIKRGDGGLTLELVPNPDILGGLSRDFPHVVSVGFAAETQDLLQNARSKLERKGIDLIVANDVTEAGSGFGADTNRVTLLFRNGDVSVLPLMSKRQVADRVLDAALEIHQHKGGGRGGARG